MSGQNVILGKTINRTPLSILLADDSSTENAKPVTVDFGGDHKVLLDLNRPAAAAWAKMMDYLQKNHRPVYVETDQSTGKITRLCVPETMNVWQIDETGKDVVKVSFHTSSTFHYLHRNHPDFQTMLDALKNALEKETTLLVTSTLHKFEIIDVRALPAAFVYKKLNASIPETDLFTPLKPVTVERAKELFDMLASKSCEPGSAEGTTCIPFRYPASGCWVRAHLMCFLLIEKGETPQKVWNEGSMKIRTTDIPGCKVSWPFHVAPTLMVIQEDGIAQMVFDPSMFDEPVTVKEWVRCQNDPNSKYRTTHWTQFDRYSGEVDHIQIENEMEKFRIILDDLVRDEGPAPYKCED